MHIRIMCFLRRSRAVPPESIDVDPNASASPISAGISFIFVFETVLITAHHMPDRLIVRIASTVARKEPGFRKESCVFSSPSSESWYFTQPQSFIRAHTDSVR